MFAPTKVWRKWHQKVNVGQRRFATASALAASASPALLFARGHRVANVPEVPLVVDSKAVDSLNKTKAAVALLQAVGAGPDLVKVQKSRKMRAGKGKLRNRRFRQRRGPLVVYNPETDGKDLVKAFRNIPGVETSPVFSLNLLQLAPGGHLGRFVIWTSSAFQALDQVYGTTTTPSALKRDYLLPSNVVANADLTRLINSSEIQSVLQGPKGEARTKRVNVQKKNPLRNKQVMLRLNPYAAAYSKQKLGQQSVEGGKPTAPAESFINTLYEN
jgi:large subunit ribosomal protein L4e